jgi:hypothetical protein
MPFTENMLKSLGHFRFLILVICGLSVGCADFNTVERFGVIQIRLPAENKSGLVDVKLLDQKVPEGIELVEAILKAHQFSRMYAQGGREESNTAVALQLMNAPNTIKPVAMPQQLRSTWVLPIDHPGTIPDKVLCGIYPTEGSNLLQVSVRVEYAWRVPPLVTQFWHDLVEAVTQKYGTNRVTTDTNL